MLFERDVQRYTRSTCVRLEVEDDRGTRLRVTSESYLDGKNLVEGEFARAHPEPSDRARRGLCSRDEKFVVPLLYPLSYRSLGPR